MNILLVDDHNLYREALELLLTNFSDIDKVFHAETSSEALTCVKENDDIHLVLLDYNLEDGLGIDVLLRIKSIQAELPVAIISADDDPNKVQQCISSGANGYILKKMKTDEIGEAITFVMQGNTFIPKGIELPSADKFAARRIEDAASNIMNEQDPSLRVEDEASDCTVSAFNHLLGHLHDNQEKLKQSAFKDELTGLYNRRYFLEQLENAFRQQARTYQSFALVYIDLDHFKEVNDTHGHQVGDLMLKVIAERIMKETRESDLAARIGGDEFTMLLFSVFKENQVLPYLNRMLHAISQPVEVVGVSLTPSCSIGAALSLECQDVRDLIKRADDALYAVKRDGKNGVMVYS